jgi:hypothetical protein
MGPALPAGCSRSHVQPVNASDQVEPGHVKCAPNLGVGPADVAERLSHVADQASRRHEPFEAKPRASPRGEKEPRSSLDSHVASGPIVVSDLKDRRFFET